MTKLVFGTKLAFGLCFIHATRQYGHAVCYSHMQVFGLAHGCLGTAVVGDSSMLVPLPPHISPEDACTLPTVFVTVEAALRGVAAVRAGERVLVHAGTGGVGLAAMQVSVCNTFHFIFYYNAGLLLNAGLTCRSVCVLMCLSQSKLEHPLFECP